MGGDKEWSPSQSFEPAKRASEEQLFEEVGLLMQERDLLLREKSALQAILASSKAAFSPRPQMHIDSEAAAQDIFPAFELGRVHAVYS